MELKNKEITFRKLQMQIKKNSKSINLYKKWIPVLMLVFIAMLVMVFLTLTRFHVSIHKMQKENRNLDSKIYDLLKL